MHALRNVLSRSTLIKPNRYISSAFKNYAKTDDSGGESNESSANKSESDEDTKVLLYFRCSVARNIG